MQGQALFDMDVLQSADSTGSMDDTGFCNSSRVTQFVTLCDKTWS